MEVLTEISFQKHLGNNKNKLFKLTTPIQAQICCKNGSAT
jgi:hypothetical protein